MGSLVLASWEDTSTTISTVAAATHEHHHITTAPLQPCLTTINICIISSNIAGLTLLRGPSTFWILCLEELRRVVFTDT